MLLCKIVYTISQEKSTPQKRFHAANGKVDCKDKRNASQFLYETKEVKAAQRSDSCHRRPNAKNLTQRKVIGTPSTAAMRKLTSEGKASTL